MSRTAVVFIATILALLLVSPSFGAISNVQHGTNSCSTNACTFTWGGATTANNLLVVYIALSVVNSDILTSASAVHDSGGHNFTRARIQINTTDTFTTAFIYYLQNAPSGTTVVVTQDGGATNNTEIHASEWSGAATSSVLDTSNSNTASACNTSNCEVSGSITTAVSGELVISGFTESSGSGYSGAGTGYTILDTSSFVRSASEYKIGSGAGSEQAVITGGTTSFGYVSIVAAFKPPSTGHVRHHVVNQ